MSAEFGGRSWLPWSNSVKSSTAGKPTSEDSRTYEEKVARKASECVEEFVEEYPERAHLPISRSPGRALRSELVEEQYEEEYVEGEEEWQQGFTTRRLDRVEPVTWAEALYEFLTARQPYDDGVGGKFREVETEETFTVDFHDCWTTEYGNEQAGKNAGAQRQLMGGEYPDRAESSRSGEVEVGVWSDDIATVMLTRTGSSVPGGSRLAPVDMADEVTRTWSEGGVYDTVRNICEYHLELESDEWGYVRGDDVHGMGGGKDGDRAGKNACYPHCHDAIYFDLEATGLRGCFDSDHEIKAVLRAEFYRAIETHLESCEIAKAKAHTPEKAVEVRLDLEEPAGYATQYLRLDEEEDMMDMPVEFQAFAAVEWAANRQRIARSQLFTEAAKADLCKQDKEHQHGERLRYDHAGHGEGELVCSHCGSGVGIEADTMTEHRLREASCEPAVVADGGEVQVGASTGEPTERACVRSAVEEHIAQHGEPESVPAMLGELGVEPGMEVVEEVLEDRDRPAVEPVMGRPEPRPEHELESIIQPDGTEEPASSGGGVDTTELLLPEERLLRETRLRWVGGCRPKIVVESGADRLATYNPEVAASWLVRHGYRQPWHAELALSFTRHGKRLPEEFEEPEAEPPPGVCEQEQ